MNERKKDTFNLATEETGRSINRKSIKVVKFIESGFGIVFKVYLKFILAVRQKEKPKDSSENESGDSAK